MLLLHIFRRRYCRERCPAPTRNRAEDESILNPRSPLCPTPVEDPEVVRLQEALFDNYSGVRMTATLALTFIFF